MSTLKNTVSLPGGELREEVNSVRFFTFVIYCIKIKLDHFIKYGRLWLPLPAAIF